MGDSLTQFFKKDHIDLISITDLETLIHRNPEDIVPKLLLSKKMNKTDIQELMLHINDRTAIHFLLENGKIPSISDLNVTSLVNSEINAVLPDNTSDQDIDQKISDQISGEPNNDVHHEEIIDMYKVDNPNRAQEDIPLQITDEVNFSITEPEDPTNIYLSESYETSDFPIDLPESVTKPEVLFQHTVKKKKAKKSKKSIYTLKEFSGISAYSKWLLTFKKTDIDKKIKKEEKAAKRKAIEATANKSIEKSTSIISEPLADLLASQGHFDEAKKMYEQLMMKYPEKSSYFAAKINQNIKY